MRPPGEHKAVAIRGRAEDEADNTARAQLFYSLANFFEVQKPFEYEQELNQKISRLTDLDMQLQAEAGSNKQVFVDGEEVGGSDAPERRKTLEEELREITARPASYEKNQAKEVMEFAR